MPFTKSKKAQPSRQTKQAPVNQDPASHAHMHREHVSWMSDIETWRDDLVQWQSEIRKVFTELKQLESMLRQHELALVTHSEELLAHRQKMVNHERALSEFEQEGPVGDLIEGSRDHRVERETHAGQQTRHEAIKHRQRGLVAQWLELHKKISQLPQI